MAGLPRAIVDLDDYTESKNILIYGDTGTGKTILTGQLPGKVLVLSSEGGTIVIKRYMQRMGQNDAKRFKVWPIRRWDDLEDAYTYLRDGGADDWDWIAIDSLTSLQHRALRAAMETAVKRNPEKRDIDLPDKGEHQKHQNATKRMVQDFNELPVNVLWLAQSMYREDRDGNEIVLPFVMGKDYEVSSFVCANVHAFGCYLKQPSKTKAGETRRVLLWDSFADAGGVNHWAKDRYQVLPKFVVMADGDEQKNSLGDLLALIDEQPGAQDRADQAVQTRDDPGPIDPTPGEQVVTDDDVADARGEEPDEKGAPEVGVQSAPETEPDLQVAEAATEEAPPSEGRGAAMAEEDWDNSQEALDELFDREARRAELEALKSNKDGLRAAVAAAGIDIATLKGVKFPDVITKILNAEEAQVQVGLGDSPVKPDQDDEPEPVSEPEAETAPKKFRATDDEEN